MIRRRKIRWVNGRDGMCGEGRGTYDETAFGGVDAAGLERLRAAFENELFETLGVFPACGGEVGVCLVRVFDEGLS